MGAIIGACITSPLEVVKTRLQAKHHKKNLTSSFRFGLGTISSLRSLIANEGFFGLYRGLSAHLTGVFPARSLHFFIYGNMRSFLHTSGHFSPDSDLIPFISSISAALVVVTSLQPVWLVKTRLQLQTYTAAETLYRGPLDCVVKTIKGEGILGLYKGMSASLLGISESCIQFVLYEKLKRMWRDKKIREGHSIDDAVMLSIPEIILSSGVSKLIASSLTYPHEVIRTRLREQSSTKYRNVIHGLKVVAREEGRAGLYGGMGPHLMRVVPNSAILLITYEITLSLIYNSRFGQVV
eukprot:TRINITY_DN7451_c0_g1_i2.p1 TRINITY_DN7451_c0_g1~~TRINITY_DN7451_c0_g1_i2.p1  ORF type:complete len:295 (+),score=36.55 TRINITY_DN7451_c0_g1_i2:137-1021(+)